jgi:hypothetical protein
VRIRHFLHVDSICIYIIYPLGPICIYQESVCGATGYLYSPPTTAFQLSDAPGPWKYWDGSGWTSDDTFALSCVTSVPTTAPTNPGDTNEPITCPVVEVVASTAGMTYTWLEGEWALHPTVACNGQAVYYRESSGGFTLYFGFLGSESAGSVGWMVASYDQLCDFSVGYVYNTDTAVSLLEASAGPWYSASLLLVLSIPYTHYMLLLNWY